MVWGFLLYFGWAYIKNTTNWAVRLDWQTVANILLFVTLSTWLKALCVTSIFFILSIIKPLALPFHPYLKCLCHTHPLDTLWSFHTCPLNLSGASGTNCNLTQLFNFNFKINFVHNRCTLLTNKKIYKLNLTLQLPRMANMTSKTSTGN